MEKRKWPWKRKSSERSPGDTESSGSISSHSDNNFDDHDQEASNESPNHIAESPEVTPKPVCNSGQANDSIRNLTEKLSAALVNVSAKEDLVKQHSKVAEDAVAGWEKAENEVAELKQKLEAAVKQNSNLEDRVSHLDGALKECVRQLRQAREEQELKIHEAVEKRTQELVSEKAELENRLIGQQGTAVGVEPVLTTHVDSDLLVKLESLEKKNSALKLELSSQSEELELRTLERDLSTQAAETASKQHLESIKKVAKLETECRRLKAIACKPSLVSDHKSTAATSISVESITDTHSDIGEQLNRMEVDTWNHEKSSADTWASALIAELDQFKTRKASSRNLPASSIDIDLMDDFLEMERLAALPEEEKIKKDATVSDMVDKQNSDGESTFKAELEAVTKKAAELEEKLEAIEAEKAELVTALAKSRECMKVVDKQNSDAEISLGAELEAMTQKATEMKEKLETMEAEKAELVTALAKSRECMKVLDKQNSDAESSLRAKLEAMTRRASELEEKLETMETEKAELETSLAKCREHIESMAQRAAEVEERLENMKKEKAELEIALAKSNECAEGMSQQAAEFEEKLEKMEEDKAVLEVALAKNHKHMEAMAQRAAELEEMLEKMQKEKAELETALTNSQECVQTSQLKLRETETNLDELQKVICEANELKQSLESQLISTEAEARTMSAKIDSLQTEYEKERVLSAEFTAKCKELEEELTKMKHENELRKTASTVSEPKIKQEDLTVAAGKLAECQQTIASLGKQLKSLATLEDFLIDTTSLPEFSAGRGPLVSRANGEPWRLHANETFSPKREAILLNPKDGNTPPSSSSATSSATPTSNSSGVEKNRNGFAKFFSRSKNGIQLEI